MDTMDFLEIGGVSIILAFVAGLLSVASPCVLPLVPAYLGYLTGAALEGQAPAQTLAVQSNVGAVVAVGAGAQTHGTEGSPQVGAGTPTPEEIATPSPFLHSLAFVGGFSAVFIAFGVSLGLIGYVLRDNADLILKISGTLLIVMGLHLAGVITIPLMEQERRLDVGRGAKIGYARSFAVGAAFSAGWSPCIGPTLGAIFALAVSSGTVIEAASLLAVYSAGLSVPFLALGLAYNSVKPIYTHMKRYVWIVNYLSGALLIIIGILIFTDSLINLNSTFDFWPFNELAELEAELEE
jgi:cytochrome c-type biogenesis protein